MLTWPIRVTLPLPVLPWRLPFEAAVRIEMGEIENGCGAVSVFLIFSNELACEDADAVAFGM